MNLLRFKSVIILLIASHLISLTVGADPEKPDSNVDPNNNGAQGSNDDETKGETPFPNFFFYLDNSFHIESEVIKTDEPRVIMSEYYHGPLGSTLVTRTNHEKKESFLSDFARGEIYKYQPYRCDKITTDSLQTDHGFEGLKTANLPAVDPTANSHVLMGVSALWFNAMRMPKYFDKKAVIFSALRQTMVPCDKWVAMDPHEERMIEFFFLASTSPKAEPNAPVTDSLEMIRILNHKSEEIEVINVISYNLATFTEQQKDMFKIPLGYGCKPKMLVDWDKFIGGFITDNYPRKIDMEISATKYSDSGVSVSTIGLEYAWAPHGFGHERNVDARMMCRTKGYVDKSKNFKHVIDAGLSASYRIDLMEGTCEVKSYTDNYIDRISFSNGLGPLTIDDGFMKDLMSYKTNQFVDSTDLPGGQKMHTFESNLYYFAQIRGQSANKQARMIQVFKSSSETSLARLDYAIIQVYNEELTKIMEVYRFDLADIELLYDSAGDIARVFDVSDCFKDPGHSRWIRVRYPIEVRWAEYLAPHPGYVRKQFSRNLFQKMGLDYLRVPEIEVYNEQTAIVIRALLLDRPPILTTFVPFPGYSYTPPSEDLAGLNHLASNADECSNVCKLYDCHMFSYCPAQKSCTVATLLSAKETVNWLMNVIETGMKKDEKLERYQVIPKDGCTLYAHSKVEDGRSQLRSLADVLSELSHDNYDRPIESDQDNDDDNDDDDDNDSDKVEEQNAENLPKLAFKIGGKYRDLKSLGTVRHLEHAYLIPTEFEIEQDPLDVAFPRDNSDNLDSQDESGDISIPAFHDSLGHRRFRKPIDVPNKAPSNVEEASESTDPKKDLGFTVVSGQSYDECALLCADSDCSTFSYCQMDQQCITSKSYDTNQIMENSYEDASCIMAQRDFLPKFRALHGFKPPKSSLKTVEARDPSECARLCMHESTFTCLSFDFCSAGKFDKSSKCHLNIKHALGGDYEELDDRVINSTRRNPSRAAKSTIGTCDHYSRSYLADFDRFEHKAVNLVSMPITNGINVDQCAEQCINNNDCSLFQFCFDPQSSDAKQQCSIIDRKITRKEMTYKSLCSIYSLKKGALDLERKGKFSDEIDAVTSGGSYFGSILITSIICFILSMFVGFMFALARRNSDSIERFFRRQLEVARFTK